MAGTDRVIDPLTGDYVLDTSTGAYETTRTARTAVYHTIKCQRLKWAADADFGSRLYQLARGKNLLKTPKVLEDMISEALADLVAAGRISKPVILTERDTGRILLECTTTDLQSGEEIVVTDLIPFQV